MLYESLHEAYSLSASSCTSFLFTRNLMLMIEKSFQTSVFHKLFLNRLFRLALYQVKYDYSRLI